MNYNIYFYFHIKQTVLIGSSQRSQTIIDAQLRPMQLKEDIGQTSGLNKLILLPEFTAPDFRDHNNRYASEIIA